MDSPTLIFDMEGDGLLPSLSKMHVLVVYNYQNKEQSIFFEGDDSWKQVFENAGEIVGHNIIGYDLPAFKKLFDWELPKNIKIVDTLLYSQILNYRRFKDRGHSLAVWADSFNLKKVEHEDWSVFSEEMLERCVTDVEVNVKVYERLMSEYEMLKRCAPQIEHYIYAEHRAAQWNIDAEVHGWPFDYKNAAKLYQTLKTKVEETTELLESKLGTRSVPIDMIKNEVEVKEPKWTKDNFYTANVAKWFEIDPVSGYPGEERLVEGPYCRVKFRSLKLSSTHDVKLFLFRNGWVPTEYNSKYDPETKTKKKTSPKITQESLEFLGGDGRLYLEYLIISSRYNVLKTWLEHLDNKGYLHGEFILIGTPSMRSRHKVITNIPSPNAMFGTEIRKLFQAKKGWKIIGADSSGNQARGLAHYLRDKEYIDVILNKDIHEYNKEHLNKVLIEMNHDPDVTRPKSKRILYAFLFGASGAKLWSYVFGFLDSERGKEFKEGFVRSVPGFKDLVDRLKQIYGKTRKKGEGYIPSIAGNKIFVDSWHKLLVYLLQSCEKITCSSALAMTMDTLEKEKIPYIPLVYYHDEIQFMVPEEYVEKAAKIAKESFKEAPKLYSINIMDGDSKIGDNWLETH